MSTIFQDERGKVPNHLYEQLFNRETLTYSVSSSANERQASFMSSRIQLAPIFSSSQGGRLKRFAVVTSYGCKGLMEFDAADVLRPD